MENQEETTTVKEEATTKIEAVKPKENTRRDNCARAIEKILKEYNCTMTAQMVIGENHVSPQILVIPNREVPKEEVLEVEE